jgi:hypothetical protein
MLPFRKGGAENQLTESVAGLDTLPYDAGEGSLFWEDTFAFVALWITGYPRQKLILPAN